MGYDNISKVRIGKYIELELTAENKAVAQQQLDKMCESAVG